MNHSKLSDHEFKKGKFITPFNSIEQMHELSETQSWTYGRMPEYIWMGLVFNEFGRDEGFKKLYRIIMELHRLVPAMPLPKLSNIVNLDETTQRRFFDYLITIVPPSVLSPLTVFLTCSAYPVFTEYFYSQNYSIDDRCKVLSDVMNKLMSHQSNQSTDIRYVVSYFNLLLGNTTLLEQQAEHISCYPTTPHSSELMRLYRPSIRTLELMSTYFDEANLEYLNLFWRNISEMTECNPYSITFPREERNISLYMERLYEIYNYLSELFVRTSPLDEKMNVLLGIATYSYKRFKECYDHNLFNSFSGRSCVRVLIEDYIMIKYLVKNESKHDNIWKDFQLYGLGLYKLVLARYRESEQNPDSHFDVNYIEALVNEFKEEEFIDMDTRYFDKQNIREKAKAVEEKDLFGLFYDYDSSFEHGLWGAIRESSLLKCNNPAHQYHCVLDVDDNNIMKSALPDCIMVMNKTLSYINELYGVPEELMKGVIDFDLKSIE